MKRSLFFSFLPVLFFVFGLSAQAALTHDLALQSITFSKQTMLAGEQVRIYASVKNNGTEDEVAYVTFWQGGNSIGNSQLVTLRADSVQDEVFVDFTVPDQAFNIRAVVKGETAGDQNAANDEKVTGMISPLPDEDHDGVTDSKDNCPSDANSNQLDNDKDGAGDVCDDDDDNDGISDVAEATVGTDPKKADTDGDGVKDPDDAYPLDPSKSKVPPPPPPPPPSVANSTEQIANSADENSSPLMGEEGGEGENPPSPTPPIEGGELSAPVSESSSPSAPKATTRASKDESLEDLRAGFWSFGNPYVKGLLALLVLAAAGLMLAERVISKKYKNLMTSSPSMGEDKGEGVRSPKNKIMKQFRPKRKSVRTDEPKNTVTAKRASAPRVKKVTVAPASDNVIARSETTKQSLKEPPTPASEPPPAVTSTIESPKSKKTSRKTKV